MEIRIQQCRACQEGVDGVTCLRSASPDGLCLVADLAPVLLSSNQLAVQIYHESQGSANQITGDDKTRLYVKPTEVEALMRVHGITEDSRPGLLTKVFLLQDIANRTRRGHPRQKGLRNRRRL